MQAYSIRSTNGQPALELTDAPQPVPQAGQVLVRVCASSLNRGEFIPRHGPGGKPGTLKPAGNEAAGEVVAVGPDVRGLKTGDRVMGRCPGAFAQYCLMDQREAMPVPAALSWEEAAAIPLVFMVAYDMLVAQGRMAAGESLLVAGVSSGVGVASLQMANAMGIKVIGTSGSPEKLGRLDALGLDVGICTRGADFLRAVMAATDSKGVDLAVNAVGGTVFAECLRALAYEGRLAMVGYVDGMLESRIDLDALHAKRLTLFGVSNKFRTTGQRAALVRQFSAGILPMFADGRIKPLVDKVYAFDQLPAARSRMEADLHVGKIVIRMPN